MLTLSLALALGLGAPPSGKLPSTELPGLERQLRWGMSSAQVAAAVQGFAWLGGEREKGHGMAAGTATVVGRPATLIFQLGQDHLAVVMVVFDLAGEEDVGAQYGVVGRALRKRLGPPTKVARPAAGSVGASREEGWRVRGSEITHALGAADGRLQHVLHLSDARRPNYGEPSPDYVFRGGG